MESELMADWSDYKREEQEQESRVTGKLRCVIVGVEETESKASHLPMIIVSIRPSGCRFSVKTYIVKNEYFNSNMTRFFDAFPEIGDGNFDFLTWVGAEGAALFDLDENGYLKIKRWVYPTQAASLPPFEGEKPERQEVTRITDAEDDDDGMLPF